MLPNHWSKCAYKLFWKERKINKREHHELRGMAFSRHEQRLSSTCLSIQPWHPSSSLCDWVREFCVCSLTLYHLKHAFSLLHCLSSLIILPFSLSRAHFCFTALCLVLIVFLGLGCPLLFFFCSDTWGNFSSLLGHNLTVHLQGGLEFSLLKIKTLIPRDWRTWLHLLVVACWVFILLHLSEIWWGKAISSTSTVLY